MKTIKSCLMGLCVAAVQVVLAADPCYVDVLFAVDAKASAYLQDEKELTVDQYAANQLAGMNAVLTNSGLHTSFLFRSAGVYELGFEAKLVDSTKALTRDVLENATGGKGIWEDLHTERDNRGADVVSVIIDTGSEYGHAGDGNALTNLSAAAAFSESAYSVVGVRSTFAYHAVLHEIGHNMGAGHAAEVGTGSHATSAAYGYYFTGNTKSYYTVMGYPKSGYSPAPVFSTPDKQYDGVAAGTTTKDNVSVLKQTCQAASQWRSLPAKAHPTMTVAWHQHAPFNSFAPVIGSDADVPCGCAATAAAQMFKHYAWPVRIGSVFEGKTQKYVGNTSYPFPIRLDGHNDFQWTMMNDNASANDAVGNFEAARMTLWCDAMAGMDFRSGDSSALFDDIAENASQWYQKGKSTYYSDGDVYWKAITNALDRGELVQFTFKTHQVVADDYKVEGGVLSVHLNYGHAQADTRWYTQSELVNLGLNYVWTGFTPKKMAQLKPLPKQVNGSVPFQWDVPAQYADEMNGFTIMGYYPADMTMERYAYPWGAGTMAADRAGTYALKCAYGMTATSKISYTLNSYHTAGIKVELQARFDADEWVTIDTPQISTNETHVVKNPGEETGVEVSGWLAVTNEVDLGGYANKTAEFRFKVSRTAKTRTKDGQLYFVAPTWSNIRPSQVLTMGLGEQSKNWRSYTYNASGIAGKVVSFTIEPIMADSVVSEPVATKVVATSVPAQPEIVSVEGVTDGFRRTCGIGKNEFIVNVNETTTKVTALPSHLALVGDDDVVEVTDLGNQTWSVAIDATDVPENSQLILTLCAEDALGNKAYKDLQLTFKEGGEEPEEPAYDAEVLATFYGFDTPTSGNYTVTLDNGAYRFSSATAWNGNSDGLSVLVRYSGYVQPTANAFLITLKNSAVGSGAANALGVFAQATDGTIHGVWNNATWTGSDKDASKVQVCDKTVPAEGYLVLTYKGSEKTKLYASDGTVLYEASALRTSALDQQIGDLVTVGSASATMTVEGVRIFKGALAQDEITAAVADFEKDMPEPIDEMYHNRLSGGSEVVPTGWYGAITVPANGYKATAFGAATQLANTESDDEVVGSYADIIKDGTDIAAHTLAGWFKVDALPTAEGSANVKTLYAAKSIDGNNYGGYKVGVDSTGRVFVGQCDDENWRNDSGKSTVYTTAAHVAAGNWFHLAVAVPGRTDSTRTTMVTVFVNGVKVETVGGPFGTNLNGNRCEYVRIGTKGVTSGLGISAAGIYVDKAALDDARTVVYVAKHVPVEVPAVRPDIIKDPTTHTWTVDTTKIGYAFTSSEIAEMKATAWKVALKSASEYGATVDFGTVSGAQKSHFVIENGSHAMVWTNGNSNINFNTDGTDDDPSILVKGGATLNFTVRDFTGWEGNAAKKKGNVVRVNGGGTLNLIQYKTSEKGYTHYYQGRYWLDPGASVVADFAGDQFRLNGGAIEGCEQLYVPDSEEGASAATLTVLHKLCIAKDTTAGVGVYVGTHSTLEINADITSNSANPLEKWGAGTLGINGSLADFTGALTVHAGTLKLAENVIGGSLVMDAGTTIDIAHEGEIADGTVLLTAGSIDIGNATLLVNGNPAPEVHVSGGKLKVGKPPITTLLNPYAVTEGGVIKVSCNAEAPTSEAAKAYDGDAATYFAPGDAANAKGVSWTGIAFSNGVIVTEISFSSATRRRMIGGAFQGANLADYSDATNVYVVESYSGGTANVELPEAKGPYKYLRFIGMYGGNASEIKYYGLADSGAVAPTNAPTVLASWSTNGIAGLTLKADAAIPQVYVVQRAMRNFCEDEDDYEACVTLAPQLGVTTTWTDGEATGYALYRMQGRNANGASAWTYFEIEPEKLIAGPVAPTFKGNGPGFYASEASVEIAYGVPGAQIYYTLDGSTPTTNSLLYVDGITLKDVCAQDNPLSLIMTNPKELTNNIAYGWHAPNGDQPNVNVIRARAFLPDGSASTNEIAGTWMIGPTVGEHLTNGLRVVSVITDRENYFGDPKGIMVPGDIYNEKGWVPGQVGQPNANYFQRGADWERPAFVEMFDEKGVEMFSNKMGTRVHGNWSRAAAKKTLVCYSRKELGSKNIKLDKKKFRMFNDEPDHNKYKRIMLRNGGNDWYKACLRDTVGQSMFRGYVNTGTQGYEPMAMYVNGEYWGVYNLRHAYSKQHFEEWNGAVEDDIDYVKLDPDSGDHFEVQEGDFTAMWNIMQYMIKVTGDDVMDDAEYAVVSNQVDIADMIDFHIVNIFLCNADWIKNGNNMGYWRNRSGDDRKWHFTVYDCDSAMAFDSNSYANSDKLSVALNVNDTDDGNPKMAPGFLKRCFMNDGFKKRFANRFADLLNTALRVERTTNIVTQAAARIEPEIARTAARWTNMGSVQAWNGNIQSVRTFFVNRPAYAFNQVAAHCSGGDPVEIEVTTNGLGSVMVNTVASGKEFQLPFRGKYFGNIPITLAATPASGEAFAGWKIGDEIVSTEPTLTLAPTNGVTFTACFEAAAGNPQQALRLVEIYGSTNTAIDPDGDTGEFVVVTNTSDRAVNLDGLKIESVNRKKSETSLLFVVGSGVSVGAKGSYKFEKDACWPNQKISNGKILMTITDSDGDVIQTATTEFKDDADGKGASLVAQNLDNPCDDWMPGPIHDVPPGPQPGKQTLFTGDYPKGATVTLTNDTTIVVSNAAFGAALNFTSNFVVTVLVPEGTASTLPAMTAAGKIVLTGEGALSISNNATLITCGGLTVEGGVLDLQLDYDGGDTMVAAEMSGSYIQNGGEVRLRMDCPGSKKKSAYGFRWKKQPGCVVELNGGTFDATMYSDVNSAAFKANEPSNDVLFGKATVTGDFAGTDGRMVDTDGEISIKSGAKVTVGSTAKDSRVFKTSKSIKLRKARVDVEATGADSEIFSADDAIDAGHADMVLVLKSTDDCFSAQTNILLSAGVVYGRSTAGDVFDSNGKMTVSGGTILAYTLAEEHAGFDTEPKEPDELDHTLTISGGTVVALGGAGSAWPTNCVFGQAAYTNTACTAADWSGKYLVAKGSAERTDVTTTALLPEICDTFIMLVTMPGLTGVPTASEEEPAVDPVAEGVPAWTAVKSKTFQEYLRFIDIYGSTASADKDVGEWFVLTNISDKTVAMQGLEIEITKTGDKKTKSKCNFSVTNAVAVAPSAAYKFEKTAWGWNKITNGDIHYVLSNESGTIQQGYLEFCAAADGGGASMVTTNLATELTYTDWEPSFKLPATNTTGGAGIDLDTTDPEKAAAKAKGYDVVLTEEDKAAGVEKDMLTMAAVPVTNETGAVTGYKAVVAVNPEVVDEPSVGGDQPIVIKPTEGGTEVSVGINNATKGLWYGYEVSEELGKGFANDVPSFDRATGTSITITGSKRSGNAAFFRVKVLPAQPSK